MAGSATAPCSCYIVVGKPGLKRDGAVGRDFSRDSCKRIVAPEGSAIAPATEPQPDGTLVKALARAWRWQRMLESGEYATLAELADGERISRSCVCRFLRLTLLAPDLVERILDGRPTAGLAQFLQPFPVAWERQRVKFAATAA